MKHAPRTAKIENNYEMMMPTEKKPSTELYVK